MSFVSELFNPDKDKPPSLQDPEIEEQRRKRRLAASLSKGRQSTIVAGEGGVEDGRYLGRSVLTGPGV